MTKPRVQSLALSSGEEDGGDGVVRKRQVRRRWRRSRWFISAFSLSADEEGDWVESRDETKMGEEGRDIIEEVG